MSKLLRKGRLGSARGGVTKFTSSIRSDEKLLKHVVDINRAHIVMLMEQEIVDRAAGTKILGALKGLETRLKLKPSHEDVHMAVEEEVTKTTGREIGGNLHLAKSRNDQVSTAIRMALREELIKLMKLTVDLQTAILGFSKGHTGTLMPGYTHLQPAQPITFAHYLLSFYDTLRRDLDRAREAYTRVDQCPMGAGALATTSFPISRERVAELLGFSAVLENSLDAIVSRDFILESLASLSIMAVNISRFVEDLIIWCTSEFGLIELPDEFSSTSSIMPQKKNPEVLEVIRARTGCIIGDLVSSLTMTKALPSSYNLDLQEVTPELWDAIEVMAGSLEILSKLVPSLTANRDIFARPELVFTTSTELANMLVRKYGIPFRTAHNIVGALTKIMIGRNQSFLDATPEMLEEAARSVGVSLRVESEDIESAVDPERFVESHNVKGGPAKKEVSRMTTAREAALGLLKRQIPEKKRTLADAKRTLSQIVNSYLSSSGSVARFKKEGTVE